MADQRHWHSQLAQELLRTENCDTIEKAMSQLINRKLSALKALNPPVDLRLIASIMGIDPNFKFIEMQQSARIVEVNGRCQIHVNQNHTLTRQRFSIAHEIGHKILAGKKIQGVKSRTGFSEGLEEKEEEYLCDLAASYLLGLQPSLLEPVLFDRGFSFDTIQFVTDQFKVSFESAVRGLVKYYDGIAAVLYCALVSSPTLNKSPAITLKRYYSTSSFPILPRQNYTMPEFLCVSRAIYSKSLIKLNEIYSFDGQNFHSGLCEAKVMPIYSEDRFEPGIILVITQ